MTSADRSPANESRALPEKWLNVEQAAEYANVGRDLIYTACARLPVPALAHVRVDRHRRILTTRQWIDEWLLRTACGAGPLAESANGHH